MAERVHTIVELSCPTPLRANDTVLLGHGSGGKLSAELIRAVFCPRSIIQFFRALTTKPL